MTRPPPRPAAPTGEGTGAGTGPNTLAVIADQALAEHRDAFGLGRHPSPLPYGLEALEARGRELVDARRVRRSPRTERVLRAAEHRSGTRVVVPWDTRLAARASDVTLAVLDHWAHGVTLLRRAPGSAYRRTRVVSLLCWAAEDLRSGDLAAARRVRRILHGSDLVAYWSHTQTPLLRAHGARDDQLLPLTFGVATQFFRGDPDSPRDIPVMAVGVDRGRDYATLARAVAGTGIAVRLLASADNVRGFDLPAEVEHAGVVPAREYADLLRRTAVVVVPTHDLAYPTGQTVALDAAAAGCAVVVSDTAAMREYLSPGVTALMPAVGDADGLRAAVRTLEDPTVRRALARAGQEHVLRQHHCSRMWHELDDALVRRGWLGATRDGGERA